MKKKVLQIIDEEISWIKWKNKLLGWWSRDEWVFALEKVREKIVKI